MTEKASNGKFADLRGQLRIDCEKCSGLCCVALHYMKADGFPGNKEAGTPCKHLLPNFQCSIHSTLASKNLQGCLTYDCLGAGQKVTQIHCPDSTWRSNPGKANDIFRSFQIVFQLHQMQWYLLEALSLVPNGQLKAEIESLILKNEQMTGKPLNELMHLEIEAYRLAVNQILRQVIGTVVSPSDKATGGNYLGKNFKRAILDGVDFSMGLMIAANLEGCSLRRASFLGADMRDANIKNTDLSASVFLTQMQINSARGNANTKLPIHLVHPAFWGC